MNCSDTDLRHDTSLLTSHMPPHMYHPDSDQSVISILNSDQWEARTQDLDTRSLQGVGGMEDMCPDSLWIVGAGQLICLIKTKTSPSPHVMIHRYNLSKLHLYHQLWVKLGQWEVATLPFLLKLWNKSSRKAANNCKSVIKYSFFSSMWIRRKKKKKERVSRPQIYLFHRTSSYTINRHQ